MRSANGVQSPTVGSSTLHALFTGAEEAGDPDHRRDRLGLAFVAAPACVLAAVICLAVSLGAAKAADHPPQKCPY